MKRIIELSENDYKALKEDGVQNHLALANTIIAHSVPYEPKIEIVPYCNVTFDKEQLQEIVDKAVAEFVADNKRPEGDWIKVKEERMMVDMSGEIVTRYKCSECGRMIAILPSKLADYPFCHCGADMRKGSVKE